MNKSPSVKNHAVHGCSPVIYKAYAHHVPVAPHNLALRITSPFWANWGFSFPVHMVPAAPLLYERLCYVFKWHGHIDPHLGYEILFGQALLHFH